MTKCSGASYFVKKKKGLLVVDNVEFLLLFESGKFDCNNNKCIYKGYM